MMNSKNILLLLTTFIFSASICLGSEKDDFPNWPSYYYENPTPEKFVEMINKFDQARVFENQNTSMVSMFTLGQILHANPEKITSWMNEISPIRKRHKELFNYMLWYSSTTVGNKMLSENTEKSEFELKFSTPPLPIYLRDPNGADILDMCWGLFFITGDEKPILNIINALKYAPYEIYTKNLRYTNPRTKEYTDKARLGSISMAAKWSLASNGKRHPRVKDIILKEAAVSTPDIRNMLDLILKDINAVGNE